MNSTLVKKIALLANVSIIAVAENVGFVLIKRFVFPPAPTGAGENHQSGE
jgi:hypothetical protein